MKRLSAFLSLARPANQLTAISDVLAGNAIALFALNRHLPAGSIIAISCLCVSTVCLYGGGVVLNDFFDYKLDSLERPERPLPAGIVKPWEAAFFGCTLFIIGIISAFLSNVVSGCISIAIVCAALLYNTYSKHQSILGPFNMGLCRSLNLLLGLSLIPVIIPHLWYTCLVPVIYISSITIISSGEVSGSKKPALYIALFLYALVVLFLLGFIVKISKIYWAILLLIPFAGIIFIPLFKAINNPGALNIRKAVKAGILALVILNATWAASVSQWIFMIAIIILLPVSVFISKAFSVT